MASVGPIRKDDNEIHLQESVNEIIIAAIRGTHIHMNFSHHVNCPRWNRVQIGKPLNVAPNELVGINYFYDYNYETNTADKLGLFVNYLHKGKSLFIFYL